MNEIVFAMIEELGGSQKVYVYRNLEDAKVSAQGCLNGWLSTFVHDEENSIPDYVLQWRDSEEGTWPARNDDYCMIEDYYECSFVIHRCEIE